ncbi:hypothetical protein RN001_006841 [Aquatica leii]|uniref:Protein ARV n=1 Tax=Aquatica leii TaxID=1421715 RepID=A0AAN7Q6E0_9COLE|nr:hypothetical protein RN001_006841 [Aquatica leii]
MKLEKYTCINCGNPIGELCKKYSETVLKLVNCVKCKNVADKYIEYDIIIVIIDLILLRKEAYRHILYNTDFQSHWKLAVMLQMMEVYSEWILTSKKKYNTASYVYSAGDVQLYMLSLRVIFRTLCSLLIILLLTIVYNKIKKQSNSWGFLKTVWKAMILANFGWFLLLPSLIWDNSIQEFHLTFVSLYTTLSQLLAYTVVCNCVKIWSIVVIVLAYSCKMFSNQLYDVLYYKTINNYIYFFE